MTLIRAARPSDIDRIMDLRRRSFEHAKLSGIVGPFDAAHFRGLFANALANPDAWLFVAVNEGETIGVTMGCASPVLLSPTMRSATELFIWVEPGHRGTGIGTVLVEAIEDWARSKTIEYVTLFSYPDLDPAAMQTLCARRGYHQAETAYMRRVS